jgi:hypothetical protein
VKLPRAWAVSSRVLVIVPGPVRSGIARGRMAISSGPLSFVCADCNAPQLQKAKCRGERQAESLRRRSWERAGIPGAPRRGDNMENDASALQNMGRPDDAALLESRARHIRGQTRLAPGQTTLYFALDDTNVLLTGIGDKQTHQPAGAAGKIWEGLGNLSVSRRVPLA